jgi:hypothetical protein
MPRTTKDNVLNFKIDGYSRPANSKLQIVFWCQHAFCPSLSKLGQFVHRYIPNVYIKQASKMQSIYFLPQSAWSWTMLFARSWTYNERLRKHVSSYGKELDDNFFELLEWILSTRPHQTWKIIFIIDTLTVLVEPNETCSRRRGGKIPVSNICDRSR